MSADRARAEREADRAARRYNIDPKIFRAQINQESGFRANAVSGAGAQGIAQFIPSTAKAYGVNLNDGRISDDLDGAARYMRDNLKRTGGNYTQALSIYNSGRPDGYKRFGETSAYVKRILAAAGASASAVAPVAAGGATQAAPMTAEAQPAFDSEGFATAQRRASLGQLIARRNPNSSLLRLGLLGTTSPNREAFVGPVGVPSGGQSGGQSSGQKHGRNRGDIVKSAQSFDRLAGKLGVPITAKQEHGHAAGGDHDPAVKGATARDFGGTEAQRQRLFREITRKLGVTGQYKGADINVTRNGLRYQIISRDHGSGPHIHVGIRRVQR